MEIVKQQYIYISEIRKFPDYKIWQITKFLYFASSQIWKLPNIKISIFCIMPNMEIANVKISKCCTMDMDMGSGQFPYLTLYRLHCRRHRN